MYQRMGALAALLRLAVLSVLGRVVFGPAYLPLTAIAMAAMLTALGSGTSSDESPWLDASGRAGMRKVLAPAPRKACACIAALQRLGAPPGVLTWS